MLVMVCVFLRENFYPINFNYNLIGVYEVGVHIADVSYFVHAGTPLDAIAGSRATSVYLVQRVRIPDSLI